MFYNHARNRKKKETPLRHTKLNVQSENDMLKELQLLAELVRYPFVMLFLTRVG